MRIETKLAAAVSAAALAGLTVLAIPGQARAHDWTGVYVGVNAGAGQNNVRWSNLVVPLEPDAGRPNQIVMSPSDGGFIGGAQVGFNQQMGPWVWGVEAAFDGSGMEGTGDCVGGYGDYHADCGTSNHWKADFTARVGGTVGPALLYVKAGGTLMGETTKADHVYYDGYDAGSYKHESSTPFGYVFGTGVEMAFTDCISGAIEYDYSKVSFTANMTPEASADTDYVIPFNVHVDQSESVVTARLNFKVW
jgi:outer membrane immunogenic protein